MKIRRYNIVYEIDGSKEDLAKRKQALLHFKTLWGFTIKDLKDYDIYISPSKATLFLNNDNNHAEIKTLDDNLIEGYLGGDNDTFLYINNQGMILNDKNYYYCFIGEAQELIKSISDYKEGFLGNKDEEELRIFESDVETYIIKIYKAKEDGRYTIRINKKKFPSSKERAYAITAYNIKELIKKVSKIVERYRDYIKSLSKASSKQNEGIIR